MPWGYVAGGIASAAAGSLLSGSKSSGGGGGTSGGSAPPVYIPTNQAGIDSQFNQEYNAYQNQVNAANTATSPYNQQLLAGQFNNSYDNAALQNSAWAQQQYDLNSQQQQVGAGQAWNQAGQQVANANQANQLYQAGLGNVQNSTNTLYGMGNQSNQQYQSLLNYQNSQLPQVQQSQQSLNSGANQVLNTAMDPQNALYNQTAQQLTDQTRASEYARGIQSSPYGASVESNALSNFDINWQNQQLARQTQGLSAAQGAYGSAQGLGNSYTSNVAGLQAGQNEQYAGLTTAAQNQYTGYLNAMNQSNAANTQNIAAAQQNASSLGNQAANSVYTAGQVPFTTNQQIYGAQNQALQNYNGNNSAYLSGLNQLQSNSLGYLNFGQGAQSVGYNQNMQNNQATQQNIGNIAGPLGNALSNNTNWSSIFGGNNGGTISSNLNLGDQAQLTPYDTSFLSNVPTF